MQLQATPDRFRREFLELDNIDGDFSLKIANANTDGRGLPAGTSANRCHSERSEA